MEDTDDLFDVILCLGRWWIGDGLIDGGLESLLITLFVIDCIDNCIKGLDYSNDSTEIDSLSDFFLTIRSTSE